MNGRLDPVSGLEGWGSSHRSSCCSIIVRVHKATLTRLSFLINGHNNTPAHPQVQPTGIYINKKFWETGKGNFRGQLSFLEITSWYFTTLAGQVVRSGFATSVTHYLWQCQDYLQILLLLQSHKQNDQRRVTPPKQFLLATKKIVGSPLRKQ